MSRRPVSHAALTLRAFLALELGDALRDTLAAVARDLRPRLPSARFVPPENLHVTLRFLGETDPTRLSALLAALGPEASSVPRFTLAARGLSAFPSERRPRVLWAGFREVPEALARLVELVEAQAVAAGFEPERRPFSAHLTLARFKRPQQGLAEAIGPFRDRDFGTFPVEAMTCFESRLSVKGASYRVVDRVGLGS